MRSDSDRISSSSADTSSTRGAPVAQGDDLLVDELDRADVEPSGRLGDEQHLDVAGELAGRR